MPLAIIVHGGVPKNIEEDFIRLLIAKRASDLVAADTSAQEAADAAIKVLEGKAGGTGGLIIVDHQGKIGLAYNTKTMSSAYMCEDLHEPLAEA